MTFFISSYLSSPFHTNFPLTAKMPPFHFFNNKKGKDRIHRSVLSFLLFHRYFCITGLLKQDQTHYKQNHQHTNPQICTVRDLCSHTHQ